MAKKEKLQGALDLLVMRVLQGGSNHGFGIATAIQQRSDDVLRVEAGSIYPALHRLADSGLLEAEWKMSGAGRRARYYRLTPKGRRKLEQDEQKWLEISAAVTRVLRTV
jgi:PadR family transcriptional regulator PadR